MAEFSYLLCAKNYGNPRRHYKRLDIFSRPLYFNDYVSSDDNTTFSEVPTDRDIVAVPRLAALDNSEDES